MLSINTNLSSLIAQQSMSSATNKLNQAIERMTTGYKINGAKDNAANYSISQNMQTQLGSYDVAADNVAMGMDLVTTASDIISNMQDKASRLQALCTQARNGTYGQQSIEAIKSEAAAIMAEIDRLSSTAEYNGVSFFEGATEGNGFISDPITYAEAEVTAMTTMTEAVKTDSLSSGGTYSISSVAELEALAKFVNDGNDTTGMTFVLGANIDLSSISNWTPIGYYNSYSDKNDFKGTFDGNGHVIKNLTIDNETKGYQGLFGRTASGSTIKNVALEGVDVKGKSYVGSLVGLSSSTITNSYATGAVTGTSYVGGLVGDATNSITNSYSIGNVSGNDNVGGLVGYTSNSITNSHSIGNVSGNDNVGGLVGSTDGKIENSYAIGDVSGNDNVGGLLGDACSNTIANSYATGSVSGNRCVGGLVGIAHNSITNSYSIGNVSGNDYVGGLAGVALDGVANSYSTGSVSGTAEPESVNNSADWDGTKFTYNYETETFSINTDGSNIGDFTLQVGINGDESCRISFNTNFLYNLGAIKKDISSDNALQAIMDFTNLLSEKSTQLGAVQNRLDSAIESISVNMENLTSSLSTIRDADIAEVSSEYIRQQILQQASATLLATANQSPSIALQLI